MAYTLTSTANAAQARDERDDRQAVQAILTAAAKARIAALLASPAAPMLGRELRLARLALHAVPADTEATIAVARVASLGLVTTARRVPLQASYRKTSARPHDRQGDPSIKRESVSEFTMEAKAGSATEAHGIARVSAEQAATLPEKATPRAFYSNRATSKAKVIR